MAEERNTNRCSGCRKFVKTTDTDCPHCGAQDIQGGKTDGSYKEGRRKKGADKKEAAKEQDHSNADHSNDGGAIRKNGRGSWGVEARDNRRDDPRADDPTPSGGIFDGW